MDIIEKAINCKLHISHDEVVNNQNWRQFKERIEKKTLFCFGVSDTFEYLLGQLGGEFCLSGVIDNDSHKHGHIIGDYVASAVGTKYEDVLISDLSVIDKPQDAVVLILSTKHYMPIIEQLRAYGIQDCYVLLIMEADRRSRENVRTIDDSEKKQRYANECRYIPLIDNKIFFYSFGTYSDHGKYICNELLKYGSLDLVWAVKDLEEAVPQGVRKVCVSNWKKYIFEIMTSKVWIFNMPIPDFVEKRSGQIYIQTKHWASITLKRFYLDSSTIQDDNPRVKEWERNGKMIDYIITGSAFDTDSCRRGFGHNGDVWEIGSPRSDAMFRAQALRDKVVDYYKLPADNHLLIYAPTYRFAKNNGGYIHESRDIDLDYEGLIHALHNRFGGDWSILLRLHPSVAKQMKDVGLIQNVYDVSAYPDSEELVAASDIMISDYSSIMFEPAFVGRPVFLFATDKEEYINQEYDLLLDYDTLPFPIAQSNEELFEIINGFDKKKYEDNLKKYLESYGVAEDGNASKRAAKLILEKINKY